MAFHAISASFFKFNHAFKEDLCFVELINIENKQLLWLLIRNLLFLQLYVIITQVD
jgi:hypothetical protein